MESSWERVEGGVGEGSWSGSGATKDGERDNDLACQEDDKFDAGDKKPNSDDAGEAHQSKSTSSLMSLYVLCVWSGPTTTTLRT